MKYTDEDAPFNFGKIAQSNEFVNRTEEINRLHQNFNNNVSTTLISSRRWGKSSLVQKATTLYKKKHKNCRIVHLDLFNVRSEEEFYKLYVNAILEATYNTFDKIAKAVSNFLGMLSPTLSISPNENLKVSIDFNFDKKNVSQLEILNLPQKIAEEKNIKIIVCLDEFQNIGDLTENIDLQKRLRAAWQTHNKVCYCIYGSKKHMMADIFRKPSMPLYKFGDLFFLEKIEKKHWVPFILEGFKKTGKKIEKETAEWICDTMKNHSYFVQQLSYFIWVRTYKKVDEKITKNALNDMLVQNQLLYKRDLEDLTFYQINYLKAVANKEEKLTSGDVVRKYKLSSSATATRSKQSLEEKQLIDADGIYPIFTDPAFEIWFKKLYYIQ